MSRECTLNSLRKEFLPYKRIGVAFSGGVDSATLLAAAARILGSENVVAFIGVSPSLARRELVGAQKFAQDLGVTLIEIATDEFSNPDYIANRGDRCYFCKDSLFRSISHFDFSRFSLDAIAYGENADDSLKFDRPGQRAASEWGAIKPLSQAGFTKDDVRALARELHLTLAEKPASPCLASRIKPFLEVTPAVIAQVEQVEDYLLTLGFTDMRARYLGDSISIEVPADEIFFLHSSEIQEKLKLFEVLNNLPMIKSSTTPLRSGSFSAFNLESLHV
jgi:uncharacterized protein